MNYENGVEYMVRMCKEVWEEKKTYRFNPINNLEIQYPGKKRVGDYKAIIAGKMLSHSEMCIVVATYVLNRNMSYEEAVRFLEDVYENGTDNAEIDPERQYLKTILFWTTLQEEINYPQTEKNKANKYYLGRRMSFNLYAEAIAAAAGNDNITLADVMNRASRKSGLRALPIANAPSYYRW